MRSPEHIKRVAEERASMRPVDPKCDRAYYLHMRGVAYSAIAERLGTSIKAVSGLIRQGKERKEAGK